MLEKYIIKRYIKTISKPARTGRWHKVPHITLVYSFRLREGVKDWDIAKIIQNIASKYRLVKFHYDGFEIRRGNKGYVFALKIKPSYELKKLRKEIYREIKPFIAERPDVMEHNDFDEDEFWFHATIGYRLSEKSVNLLKKKIQSKYEYLLASALRITLLKKSKIRYEYDIPTRKLLNRRKALSRKYYAEMVKMHREILQIETPQRPSLSSKGRIWFISDTHFELW